MTCDRPAQTPSPAPAAPAEITLDLRGVQCPGPVIALAKAATAHPAGTIVNMLADDPAFPMDLRSWLSSGQAELVNLDDATPEIHARVRITAKLTRASAARAAQIDALPPGLAASTVPDPLPPTARERCTLLVLHNDHEALLAALLVANGAATRGMQTSLFFTFWGLNLLRGDHPNPTLPREKLKITQRIVKRMMPKGPTHQRLGKLHFGGLGKQMLASIMRSQNILGLPELMRSAQDLGVGFTACTMTMSVMGITKRDLYPYPNLEFAGVATFVERAHQSSISLVF